MPTKEQIRQYKTIMKQAGLKWANMDDDSWGPGQAAMYKSFINGLQKTPKTTTQASGPIVTTAPAANPVAGLLMLAGAAASNPQVREEVSSVASSVGDYISDVWNNTVKPMGAATYINLARMLEGETPQIVDKNGNPISSRPSETKSETKPESNNKSETETTTGNTKSQEESTTGGIKGFINRMWNGKQKQSKSPKSPKEPSDKTKLAKTILKTLAIEQAAVPTFEGLVANAVDKKKAQNKDLRWATTAHGTPLGIIYSLASQSAENIGLTNDSVPKKIETTIVEDVDSLKREDDTDVNILWK